MNNPKNRLFHSGTRINNRKEMHRPSYHVNAFYFKTLPSYDGFNLLLFAYWDQENQDSYLNYPTVELQIFNRENKLIDKLIILDGYSGECSWNRIFTLFSDLSFTTVDTDICWDLEQDGAMESIQETTIYYHIDDMGKLITDEILHKE